ncbi:MAG: hypothetical protein GC160_05255 [Acidobacteria bacterium]|nr:hypothetical protein [Acidobacteriota bacterium]
MSNWMQSRQVREGSYSGAYIVVVLAILVAVNWLANQYNKTYDATEAKLYSLSDQTLKILNDLPSDATIYYFNRRMDFERPDMNGVSPKASLTRYDNASSKVEVDYVDPDANPERAELMNVRTYGTVLVEVAGRREEAKSPNEEDVTNALIKLLKGEEKTACILNGHGEAAPSDTEALGFSVAREAIQEANYKVQDVSLLENPQIPPACSLVIIAGPSTPLLEPEIGIVRDYVNGGGRLLLMIDHAKSPELATLAAEWGAQVNDDLVLDTTGIGRLFGGGPVVPLAMDYESHPITQPFISGGRPTPTLFPLTRSVNAAEPAPAGWDVQELLKTSPNSLATKDYDREEIVPDPAKDTEGPINLAVAAVHEVAAPAPAEPPAEGDDAKPADSEQKAKDLEARVVVTGTSRFARNSAIGSVGNRDLFMNMVNWLASDEDLISIRPKDPASTPMEMTESQMRWMFLGLVLGLPLVIVIAGVRTWWLRR